MTGATRPLSILAAVLHASCSDSSISPTDLEKPALMWSQTRGLCGRISAVDAAGTVWSEPGGCEDGEIRLHSKGGADPSKLQALREAFDGLPEPGGPDAAACGGQLDAFSRLTAAETQRWTACVRGHQGYDDPAGLQEPFLSLATRFLALP
jgi:hypothetical protein